MSSVQDVINAYSAIFPSSARQCVAVIRDRRCRKVAVKGSDRCDVHVGVRR